MKALMDPLCPKRHDWDMSRYHRDLTTSAYRQFQKRQQTRMSRRASREFILMEIAETPINADERWEVTLDRFDALLRQRLFS